MINVSQDISKGQGLGATLKYPGVVVDNNDPKKCSRIRVRVATTFDGIPDEHLPWALPKNSGFSGTFDVPDVGDKVMVTFQQGSASHPLYEPYSVDEITKLPESEKNYPKRKVKKLSNGALFVLDQETNTCFLRNPGNMNLYIIGDANITVDGNYTEVITGNKTSQVKGDLVQIVEGSVVNHVKGDYTDIIEGGCIRAYLKDKTTSVKGNSVEVAKSLTLSSTGDLSIISDSNVIVSGTRYDWLKQGKSVPLVSSQKTPAPPTLKKWAAIRGKQPGTDDESYTDTSENLA